MDETCISLQLSLLMDCQPPSIVEFYGASLLPNLIKEQRRLQLFLELMPGDSRRERKGTSGNLMVDTSSSSSSSLSVCMQGFLYSCGPLPVEDAHNYCYQLFEALDFLHSRVNIIHSDLKRE